jgi:hypothetical protein
VNRRQKIRGIAAAAIGTVLFVTLGASSCDNKYTEPYKDAPRTGVTNDQPADIFTMPDGFSNGATKCDHGNRVYVVYHGDVAYGSIFVVAQDPTCPRK